MASWTDVISKWWKATSIKETIRNKPLSTINDINYLMNGLSLQEWKEDITYNWPTFPCLTGGWNDQDRGLSSQQV